MAFLISYEVLGTVMPILIYWVYSGMYVVLGRSGKYRLHTKEDEDVKNLVSKSEVVKGLLFQQLVQACVATLLFAYFVHRYMHVNKFLYRHFHLQHHTLVVHYAYGALYNHPVEGLLLDTVSGALSFLISGMTPRTSIFFFSSGMVKTVDDHCRPWLPGNSFHKFFSNNSAYHDVHHQLYGTEYNCFAAILCYVGYDTWYTHGWPKDPRTVLRRIPPKRKSMIDFHQ